MTTPELTEREWATMHKGVTGAGMLIGLAGADSSETPESGALEKIRSVLRGGAAS